MDATRRLRGRRMLAIPIILIILAGIVCLALYESEGKKATAINEVAVAVAAPMTAEQQNALEQQLTEYAPKDNRAPITLKVYVFHEGTQGESQELSIAAAEMNDGIPNLYLVDKAMKEKLPARVPLEPLAEKYPGNTAVVDYGFYSLEDTPFFKQVEVPGMPALYLALQHSNTYAVTKDVQTQSYYLYQSQLLENIVNDTPGKPVS